MTDSTATRPGQNLGAGDPRALMLDLFGGEVLTAFESVVQMRDKHQVKTLSGGKSFRFPAIWRTTVGYHTPGQEILGNQIPHTEVVITPDDKLVADVFVSDIDEIMLHYDVRAPYAMELGASLARFYDTNVMRAVLLASRQGGLFTGDTGGSALTSAAYATDANTLIDGLSDAKETMDAKDVPVNTEQLYAMLKPAQWYLMARSDKNLNRFFNGDSANIQRMSLTTIDEIKVLKSNLTPFGVNDSANANIPSKYQGDYSNTIGMVWTAMAAASAEVQGLSTQVIDQPWKQGTLMLARFMTGTAPLRAKCAVELKTA